MEINITLQTMRFFVLISLNYMRFKLKNSLRLGVHVILRFRGGRYKRKFLERILKESTKNKRGKFTQGCVLSSQSKKNSNDVLARENRESCVESRESTGENYKPQTRNHKRIYTSCLRISNGGLDTTNLLLRSPIKTVMPHTTMKIIIVGRTCGVNMVSKI